jgi:hypothetical protein
MLLTVMGLLSLRGMAAEQGDKETSALTQRNDITVATGELTVVLGGSPSPAEKRVAELFAERAKDRSGIALAEVAEKAKFRLVLGKKEKSTLGADSYSIAVDVQKREVSVTGQSDSGLGGDHRELQT